MFKIVGRTTEGKFVISGVFNFHSTYGVPLDIVFGEIEKRDFIPAWDKFIVEMRENGMGGRITAKLRMPVLDVYGKEVWKWVKVYVEKYHGVT